MNGRRSVWLVVMALAFLVAPPGLTRAFQSGAAGTVPQADLAVPADLKPLLAARVSEMRLVVTRYDQDRTTISGNYANGTGRGGRGGGAGRNGGAGTGSGAPAAVPEIVPLSPNRLSRLKRFDMDWQAALGKLDASKLSPAAKTDLDALKDTIVQNLAQLDADSLTMTQVMPAVPFAPKVVTLVESRIRVEDIKSEKAARTIMSVIQDMADMRTSLEAGIAGTGTSGLWINKAIAMRAADATDNLRAMTSEWYGFYNGYDPMFAWWMGMPYKQVTAAFQDYAKFLREKVAAADAQVTTTPGTVPAVQPSAIPKFSSVPDLNEILALPQDEMRDIVARFMGGAGGGRGGRNGGGGAPAAGPDTKYYSDWLTALKTLDFDALTRNAQVDYLALRNLADTRIARAGITLPPGPPRKADNLKLDGTPRGREGLIQDLNDAMIPSTPEQLITLANKEFAWCEAEMKKASRELGYGDDWKKAVEHTKETYVPPGG